MIMRVQKQQAGFTLVELLIGLVLAIILSSAVARIVMSNSDNVKLAESYAKVQDSSRFALDYLSKDMRMAGYMGCINSKGISSKVKSLLDITSANYKPELHSFAKPINAIEGYSSSDTNKKDLFNKVTNNSALKPIGGTDVFISSSALPTDIILGEPALDTSNQIKVSAPANQLSALKIGTILMISDCNFAHIFSISNITFPTTTTAVITHDTVVSSGIKNTEVYFTGKNYAAGAQISVMNTMVFFVGKSNLITTPVGAQQINSLYRVSVINGGAVEELVPFIEDFQLDYSIDGDLLDFNYLPSKVDTADNIVDMVKQVYAINITLTVAGDVNVKSTEPDGKLRKSYIRTVQIRNAGGVDTY